MQRLPPNGPCPASAALRPVLLALALQAAGPGRAQPAPGQEPKIAPPPAAAEVRVAGVEADGRLRLEDGRGVWLQGLEPAAPSKELRAALEVLVEAGPLRMTLDEGPGGGFALLRGAEAAGEDGEARSVNARLLAEGLAFFRTTSTRATDQAALLAAAGEARRAGLGVWRGTVQVRGEPPLQRGAVLGLYYREARFDYHKQVDRVVSLGAEWLTLLVTCFVDKVDGDAVEFDPERTVEAARFLETCAYARGRGLRLKLLPIVLIRHAGEDDWRGTLRPRDPGAFWLSYDRFLCRWVDLARRGDVEMVSVGSELCSLERSQEAWERVIANARGRYGGWLTYSVNWDHYEVPRFWDLLDQVGMTAYFELTKDPAAPYAELVAAWRRVRVQLEKASTRLGRRLVLTELGYPSQDGANTAPWNYYLAPKEVDLEEQRDCFRAFVEVMGDAPFLAGVHVFDFFEEGGPEDHTYALWGKPAFDVVRRFYAGWRR
ncbi:MAG: hypothetical protein R3F30_13070 [Planctomycetota bacterium]